MSKPIIEVKEFGCRMSYCGTGDAKFIEDNGIEGEEGVCFILLKEEGIESSKEMVVQCGYKITEGVRTIDTEDCGHNWGNWGDGNEAAFDKFGEEECMKALFEEARDFHDFKLI